ncbi:MAG: prenyltransferase/squalene oxidase repeat-containing protein [Planctomycetota bacterium]|jgi:hypothetical protein
MVIGGARTASGRIALSHQEPFVVGTEPILQQLKKLAKWLMDQPGTDDVFYEGYKHRALMGLFETTHEQSYLAEARRGVQGLLDRQHPTGYWPSGYGAVYLADTATALSALINFHTHATPAERERINHALDRYARFVLGEGHNKTFVNDNGSLGAGCRQYRKGKASRAWRTPYPAATALSGCGYFSSMYYLRGNEEFRSLATNSCRWMYRSDCHQIMSPYYGEGLLQAWTYIDDEGFRKPLVTDIKAHVDWLVSQQNPDGSWGPIGRFNKVESCSHGVVNTLAWYHRNVKPGPRIAAAVRRYYLLLLKEDRKSYLTVMGKDPELSHAWDSRVSVPVTRIATAMAGRALLEIINPGIDCRRWNDK